MGNKIKEIARYIVVNHATIGDVAKEYGCTTRTIINYINKKLAAIDLELYNEVKRIQLENTKDNHQEVVTARIKKQTMLFAKYIIENHATLEETSAYFRQLTEKTDEKITCAVRTVENCINNYLEEIDPILYRQVKQIQIENIEYGQQNLNNLSSSSTSRNYK